MKYRLLFILVMLSSIGTFGQNPSNQKKFDVNQIIGDWQLVTYTYGVKPAKPKSLTSCDSSMIWNFYIDSKTKKNLLNCKDPSNSCKDFAFESDWVLSGSNLIIRRTKIMGFGGISASGTFKIKQLTTDKMILEFQKNNYVFVKKTS